MSFEKRPSLSSEFPEKLERVERAPRSVQELLTATAQMFQRIGPEFSEQLDTVLTLSQLEAVIDRYCSREEGPTPIAEWLFHAAGIAEEEWPTHEMRPYVLRIVQHMVSELNPILAELHDAEFWPAYSPVDTGVEDTARVEKALIAALSHGQIAKEHVLTVFGLLQELHKKDAEFLALSTESLFTDKPLVVEHPFRSSRVEYWKTEIALQMRLRGGEAMSGIPALIRNRNAKILEALKEEADIEDPDTNDAHLQAAIHHLISWVELQDYSLYGVSDTSAREFVRFADTHVLEGSKEEVEQLLGSCLRVASECPMLWMKIIGHDIPADYGVSGETAVRRSQLYGNAVHVALSNGLESKPHKMPDDQYRQYKQILRRLTIISGEELEEAVHMSKELLDALGKQLPGVLEELVLGGPRASELSEREKIVGAITGAAMMGPILMHWMNERTAKMLEAADSTLESNSIAAIVHCISEAKKTGDYSTLAQLFSGKVPQEGTWDDLEIDERQLHSRPVRAAFAELVDSLHAARLVDLPREVFFSSADIVSDPVTRVFAQRFERVSPVHIRPLLVALIHLGPGYLEMLVTDFEYKDVILQKVPGNIDSYMGGEGLARFRVDSMLLAQAKRSFRWSDMATGFPDTHRRAFVDVSLWKQEPLDASSVYGGYVAISELATLLHSGDIMNASHAFAAIVEYHSYLERRNPGMEWEDYRQQIEDQIPLVGGAMPFDQFLSAVKKHVSPLMMHDHRLGKTAFYRLLDGHDHNEARAQKIARKISRCVDRVSSSKPEMRLQKAFMTQVLQRIMPQELLDTILQNASDYDLDKKDEHNEWYTLVRESLYPDFHPSDPWDTCTKLATILFRSVSVENAIAMIESATGGQPTRLFYSKEIIRNLPPSVKRDTEAIQEVVKRYDRLQGHGK